MTDRHITHVIVGGGPAGAVAARTLAKEADTDDSILLISRENDHPYERLPLTKSYLAGESTKEDATYDLPDRVEILKQTSVTALDPTAHKITLQSKEVISYSRALIATGSLVNRLQTNGLPLEGLHYIRTYGNSDALRAELQQAKEVVIIGGSFVGCEVAATLAAGGTRCTIVMMESEPLARSFGQTAGRYFRKVLEDHGVTVIGDTTVGSLSPSPDNAQRIGSVTLANGQTLPADVVVIGVGAKPDVMLAKKANLKLGEAGGILCDRQLKTSADDIWAAGDICEYDSVIHGQTLRVEHHDHAEKQGAAAARNMLGAAADYTVVPYFFSDISDWSWLEYVGPAVSWAREEIDGEIASGKFMIRYLDADDRLLAALSVSGGGDLGAAREAIGQRGQ